MTLTAPGAPSPEDPALLAVRELLAARGLQSRYVRRVGIDLGPGSHKATPHREHAPELEVIGAASRVMASITVGGRSGVLIVRIPQDEGRPREVMAPSVVKAAELVPGYRDVAL